MTVDGPIVFFDGECNLCNGAVDFFLAHETAPVMRFASLQSPIARELTGDLASTLSSIVLQENGKIFTRSDAALRIATYLRPPWHTLALLRFVPRQIRDFVYGCVARMRYRLFGKRTCRLPDGPTAARFL